MTRHSGSRRSQVRKWSQWQPLIAVACASLLPRLGAGNGQATTASRPGFLGELTGHRGAIYAIAASRSSLLATGATDKRVIVWNLTGRLSRPRDSERSLRLSPKHKAGVTSLLFASDSVLLSGSADNTTRIWDVASGEVRREIQHPRTVFGIAASQVERNAPQPFFATACWDGVVRLFSLPLGDPRGELHGHSGGLYSVAISPLDDSLLASAGADRSVRIWDAVKMELLWTIRAHGDHVTTVDWSPSEPLALASGGWDRKFKFWAITSEQASACRGLSRNCSATFVPRFVGRHPQLVWRVAFAPCGELVAVCHGAVGQSPTVVLYEAASGRVVRRLGRHKDTPLSIAWAAGGSVLASAGMDHKVLLYDGRGIADDLPQGDVDDDEERARWLEDMIEFRVGTVNRSDNVSAPNRSEVMANAAFEQHPLAGRVAFW